MRLSQKEIVTIQNSFRSFFSGQKYQLYLFGSRTDDAKKGGDIDLLVVVETTEQKIDITVATKAELTTDVFLKQIFSAAIFLK